MEGRGLGSLVSKALPPRVLCYLGYPDPAVGGRRGGCLKRRTKSSRYPSGNFLSTGILFLWYILLWYSKSMVLLNG